MSAPIRPETMPQVLADVMARVRALEARRPQGGGFGESLTLLPVSVVEDTPVEWELGCDPWGYWDAGSPDEIMVPTGLDGIYVVQLTVLETGL